MLLEKGKTELASDGSLIASEEDRDELMRLADRLKQMLDTSNSTPLAAELASTLTQGPVGTWVRHPLCVTLYIPGMEPMLNARLENVRELVDGYWAKGRWSNYVYAHERPFRLTALLRVIHDGSPKDRELWELLSWTWRDSEHPWVNRRMWETLWTMDRPGIQFATAYRDRKELARLHALQKVTVYRGTPGSKGRKGISWTLDKERARWFSLRFATAKERPRVWTLEVPGEMILAYLTDRNEDEVVIDPRYLNGIHSRKFKEAGDE